MALDKLTLINQACALIGADPIDVIDEDTPSGQASALCYDRLLEFCIGVADWSFASTTVQLSRLEGVTPLSGWTHAHQLPANRIEPPVRAGPRADWPRQKFTDYVIEGDRLHSDHETMYALIRVLPHPQAMSAAFRQAFVKALAADLVMALASDRETRERLRGEAMGPPSAGGVGGEMGTAIQADRRGQPSRGPIDGYDPVTAAWRSGPAGASFP